MFSREQLDILSEQRGRELLCELTEHLERFIFFRAAKDGGGHERERGAGQKHGPPAAGEGAAGSGAPEPAEGVRAGERNLRPAEKREPSKLRVHFFEGRKEGQQKGGGRQMFVAVVKVLSVKQEVSFLFSCLVELFLVVD